MKYGVWKCRGIIIALMACGIASVTFADQSSKMTCPNLGARDVEDVIDTGIISTRQGYTLADEAGVTRAQVLINEPTANPFDTFYQMNKVKRIGNQSYWIYIGNVLGKATYEAKDRAKKILLNGDKTFSATYHPKEKVCPYKQVNASPNVSGYPFKSTYETVFLIARPIPEKLSLMPEMLLKERQS